MVAINDLADTKTLAHLLKYDSVHGRFPGTVSTGEEFIDAGCGPMRVTANKNPADLPWADVDIVLECTGIFTSKDACQAHLKNGASRVLISAPGKDADKTIVYGVNHDTLTARMTSSCQTPHAPPTAWRPIAKVLHENMGIKRGLNDHNSQLHRRSTDFGPYP